jgi:hypothetical protein
MEVLRRNAGLRFPCTPGVSTAAGCDPGIFAPVCPSFNPLPAFSAIERPAWLRNSHEQPWVSIQPRRFGLGRSPWLRNSQEQPAGFDPPPTRIGARPGGRVRSRRSGILPRIASQPGLDHFRPQTVSFPSAGTAAMGNPQEDCKVLRSRPEDPPPRPSPTRGEGGRSLFNSSVYTSLPPCGGGPGWGVQGEPWSDFAILLGEPFGGSTRLNLGGSLVAASALSLGDGSTALGGRRGIGRPWRRVPDTIRGFDRVLSPRSPSSV